MSGGLILQRVWFAVALVMAIAAAARADAQSLIGAGSDGHGWVALEYPGQGVSLLHLPPDAEPGTIAPAVPMLPSMPAAMAARGNEAVFIFDPPAPKPGAGAVSSPALRLVRRVTASEIGRPGLYVYTAPSALAPLSAEGRIEGLALTRFGPVVLMSDPLGGERRLLRLDAKGWSPAPLPTDIRPGARLHLLQRDESVVILEDAPGASSPAKLWTCPADRADGAWSVQPVGVRPDAIAAWFTRGHLMAAYAHAGGGVELVMVRGENPYHRATTKPAPGEAAIVPVGGGVAVVSAEFSPVLRLSSTVVNAAGDIVHEGPTPTVAPISRREVESLLVLLGSLVLTVIVFVFRPAGSLSDAVSFPEGVSLATPVQRLSATLIDLAPALGLSSWWFGLSPLKVLDLAAMFQLETGVWPLAMVLGLAAAHSALSEALTGRTIGKFVAGCRTITSAGMRPSFAQAIVRNLVKYACPPLSVITLMGPPAPGPHAFGTLVVRPIKDNPPERHDPLE